MAERLVPDPDAGSDFDGPPDGRLRFLQLAALHENMAEATMHRRCGRVEGYGPPGGHHRFLALSLPVEDKAKLVMKRACVGGQFGRSPKALLGGCEIGREREEIG